MSQVFGKEYAEAYDLLYAEKDYDAECDMLVQTFRMAEHAVSSVLDLGCGTGAHAVRLAQRGYRVTGVDISAEMLDHARVRESRTGVTSVEWVEGDVRSVRLDRTFDVVVCMFAVLGYQTADEDVVSTLQTIRHHLRPGGLLVFDVWYGPAVEAIGPERRVKVIATPEGELERQAAAVLDTGAHLCTVSYRLIERQQGLADHVSKEQHQMRYFFHDELESFLQTADLEFIDLRPFPGIEGTPSEESWNVVGTARG